MSELLGIVVIGRNEGERLIRCLNSINALDTAVRTVYVDSGSTDGSVREAERLGATIVTLDLTRPFTAARARNEGFYALAAMSAHLRFVQFIDGDCELVQDWLTVAVDFLSARRDVAVVCGRRRERHPDASVYNHLCDLEWDTPIGESAACGGDAMFRAEAFQAAGGYNKELIAGEEPELCLRLREMGWKIWRLDAKMTWHDAAITRFSQWWRRTVRSGYAYAEIARLHKNSKMRIYARETRRAIFWGGVLPLFIALGTIVHPAAASGFLIYPFQITRIALRRTDDRTPAWTYAIYIVIAKFAEFQGVLDFYIRLMLGRSGSLIEYK